MIRKQRHRVLALISAVAVTGLAIVLVARFSEPEWMFRRLICRQASFPGTVSNIQWERQDPLRLGLLFDLGERVYRATFTISNPEFDQLRAAAGFVPFSGDFVPGGGGTLPGWIVPDPKTSGNPIYFRDIGHGQEFLWRQPDSTNVYYLLFNI